MAGEFVGTFLFLYVRPYPNIQHHSADSHLSQVLRICRHSSSQHPSDQYWQYQHHPSSRPESCTTSLHKPLLWFLSCCQCLDLLQNLWWSLQPGCELIKHMQRQYG
jgi:hypothetical protein